MTDRIVRYTSMKMIAFIVISSVLVAAGRFTVPGHG
jgi:hypothetical protein